MRRSASPKAGCSCAWASTPWLPGAGARHLGAKPAAGQRQACDAASSTRREQPSQNLAEGLRWKQGALWQPLGGGGLLAAGWGRLPAVSTCDEIPTKGNTAGLRAPWPDAGLSVVRLAQPWSLLSSAARRGSCLFYLLGPRNRNCTSSTQVSWVSASAHS